MTEEDVTTMPRVLITVVVYAVCPCCEKRVGKNYRLPRAERLPNLGALVVDTVANACAEVQAKIDDRGWTSEMCGACRDDGSPGDE